MKLSHTVRASDGTLHRSGEHVTLIRQQMRLGVHDTILLCQWDDGTRVVLMPSDVEDDQCSQ